MLNKWLVWYCCKENLTAFGNGKFWKVMDRYKIFKNSKGDKPCMYSDKWFINNKIDFPYNNPGSTTSTISKKSEKLEMLTDPSKITVDELTYKGPHVTLPLTLLTVRNIIELYKSHKVCTKIEWNINIYYPLNSQNTSSWLCTNSRGFWE